VDLVPIVTNRLESVAARRLVCEACGTEFSCDSTGSCWCLEETVRLPIPVEGQTGGYSDCLCRDCLRRIAKDHTAATT
jgi:hypothetical protein